MKEVEILKNIPNNQEFFYYLSILENNIGKAKQGPHIIALLADIKDIALVDKYFNTYCSNILVDLHKYPELADNIVKGIRLIRQQAKDHPEVRKYLVTVSEDIVRRKATAQFERDHLQKKEIHLANENTHVNIKDYCSIS